MPADTTTTLSEFISAAIGKAADDQIAEHLFFPVRRLASGSSGATSRRLRRSRARSRSTARSPLRTSLRQ